MTRKHKKFIEWLINRLKNKYHEDPEIVKQIEDLFQQHMLIKKETTTETISSICKEFYPDFDIDRNPDIDFGFTEKDREHMRKMIVGAVNKLSVL